LKQNSGAYFRSQRDCSKSESAFEAKVVNHRVVLNRCRTIHGAAVGEFIRSDLRKPAGQAELYPQDPRPRHIEKTKSERETVFPQRRCFYVFDKAKYNKLAHEGMKFI
jgi:hypothetical protein